MSTQATFNEQDFTFMAHALRLAEQGLNSTTPNPRVGCVIVQNSKIVGEGAHIKAGEPHAEIHAINQAGAAAKGATLKNATMYVTLEPCSHTGRTPPCAGAIVTAGIAKVICAMQDPNPLVAGQGLVHLQANNIETASGLMQTQAEALNPGFIKRMTQQKPFVRCKVATSLDGKTALSNGVSQWITSDAARLDVQHWRARSCAILTGIGTILSDNPRMNVRLDNTTRQPLKVIVDSQLQTPIDANILLEGNVLIAFAADPKKKAMLLSNLGVSLLQIPNAAGKVDLHALLSHLAHMQINEILCEGGEGLNGALLAQNLIDELLIYIAPKLMGSGAKGLFALPAFTQMNEVVDLDIIEMRKIGVDIRLRAKPIFRGA
jgi:diaminohydroxyphosphoribosylaminopyrimidine deaminase / 5-amino-6-(5-phosphoribosylamino)uracil reductase